MSFIPFICTALLRRHTNDARQLQRDITMIMSELIKPIQSILQRSVTRMLLQGNSRVIVQSSLNMIRGLAHQTMPSE